ncbi:MAG: zinc-ribbon domain-containing protein, partial [Deltaproteobacteria bacterium]|nr:zinc-ribbon domain-containing protein [Deltaproteobacteria bacterium]
MIVQCDGCNTKFRLDDSKVKGQGVRVRCTKCQSVFTVMPSPPSPSSEIPASQEETFDVSFGAKPESAPKTAAVDFSSFTGEPAPPKREEEKLESPQWGAGGIDLSFEGKPKEEPKTEFDISVPPS